MDAIHQELERIREAVALVGQPDGDPLSSSSSDSSESSEDDGGSKDVQRSSHQTENGKRSASKRGDPSSNVRSSESISMQRRDLYATVEEAGEEEESPAGREKQDMSTAFNPRMVRDSMNDPSSDSSTSDSEEDPIDPSLHEHVEGERLPPPGPEDESEDGEPDQPMDGDRPKDKLGSSDDEEMTDEEQLEILEDIAMEIENRHYNSEDEIVHPRSFYQNKKRHPTNSKEIATLALGDIVNR